MVLSQWCCCADLWCYCAVCRRQYLEQTFSFVCQCPRCADQLDKLCNVPCPRCAPTELQRTQNGYLPPAAHSQSAELGLLFFDPKKAASSSDSSDASAGGSDAKPWQCNKCGAEFADKDSEIIGDYEFIRTASTRLRNWAYSNFVQYEPQQGQQRLEQVAVVLGSSHWAVHAMMAKHTGKQGGMLHGSV